MFFRFVVDFRGLCPRLIIPSGRPAIQYEKIKYEDIFRVAPIIIAAQRIVRTEIVCYELGALVTLCTYLMLSFDSLVTDRRTLMTSSVCYYFLSFVVAEHRGGVPPAVNVTVEAGGDGGGEDRNLALRGSRGSADGERAAHPG